MKSKLIILSVLVFWGCGSIPKNYTAINGTFETNRTECNTLIKEIQKKWAKHDSFHCFYYNKKLLDKVIANRDCLIKAGKNEIINLLGEPNVNENIFFRYNLSSKCLVGDNIVSDYSLDFNFDSTGKELQNIKFNKVQINY